MEPYRVLLADDEEEIRAGISRKIDWSSCLLYTSFFWIVSVFYKIKFCVPLCPKTQIFFYRFSPVWAETSGRNVGVDAQYGIGYQE